MKLFIEHDVDNQEALRYTQHTIRSFFGEMPHTWPNLNCPVAGCTDDIKTTFTREAFFSVKNANLKEDEVQRLKDILSGSRTDLLPEARYWDRDNGRWVDVSPSVKVVADYSEFIDIRNNFIEEPTIYQQHKEAVASIDSNMLLPVTIFRNELFPFLDKEQTIEVPIFTYKYTFQEIIYRGQKTVCKFFIPSNDQFFDLCGCGDIHPISHDELVENHRLWFIPDDTERYSVTPNVWNNLTEGGKGLRPNMPFLNPSPYIHNWGEYHPLFLCNTDMSAQRLRYTNFLVGIHRFENANLPLGTWEIE